MPSSSINYAQPDITLQLDFSGVIRSAVLANAIAAEATDGWLGQPWTETVIADGAQVQRMIADAQSGGVSPFHQVRQCFPSGLELSVEYTTVRLGESGRLMAIGRSLEAVTELRARLIAGRLAMERDAWKLRELEPRSRPLLEAPTEVALLIGADLRILSTNPAAMRALGITPSSDLLSAIRESERAPLRSLLERVSEQGSAPRMALHIGPESRAWLARALLVPVDSAPIFVLQLTPSGASAARDGAGDRAALDKIVKDKIKAIERLCALTARDVAQQRRGVAGAWPSSADRDDDNDGGNGSPLQN